MMSRLGVNYWAPQHVIISDFHPFVLFVHNLDEVVILDITKKGPILLAKFDSPGSKEPGLQKWQMAISHNQLLIVNPPNLI